jgi:hypothetical protein
MSQMRVRSATADRCPLPDGTLAPPAGDPDGVLVDSGDIYIVRRLMAGELERVPETAPAEPAPVTRRGKEA